MVTPIMNILLVLLILPVPKPKTLPEFSPILPTTSFLGPVPSVLRIPVCYVRVPGAGFELKLGGQVSCLEPLAPGNAFLVPRTLVLCP